MALFRFGRYVKLTWRADFTRLMLMRADKMRKRRSSKCSYDAFFITRGFINNE